MTNSLPDVWDSAFGIPGNVTWPLVDGTQWQSIFKKSKL
jgi:hypothetical protein